MSHDGTARAIIYEIDNLLEKRGRLERKRERLEDELKTVERQVFRANHRLGAVQKLEDEREHESSDAEESEDEDELLESDATKQRRERARSRQRKSDASDDQQRDSKKPRKRDRRERACPGQDGRSCTHLPNTGTQVWFRQRLDNKAGVERSNWGVVTGGKDTAKGVTWEAVDDKRNARTGGLDKLEIVWLQNEEQPVLVQDSEVFGGKPGLYSSFLRVIEERAKAIDVTDGEQPQLSEATQSALDQCSSRFINDPKNYGGAAGDEPRTDEGGAGDTQGGEPAGDTGNEEPADAEDASGGNGSAVEIPSDDGGESDQQE